MRLPFGGHHQCRINYGSGGLGGFHGFHLKYICFKISPIFIIFFQYFLLIYATINCIDFGHIMALACSFSNHFLSGFAFIV